MADAETSRFPERRECDHGHNTACMRGQAGTPTPWLPPDSHPLFPPPRTPKGTAEALGKSTVASTIQTPAQGEESCAQHENEAEGTGPPRGERKAEGHRVHQHQSGECRGTRTRPLNPGTHRTISESHTCSGLGNQRMGKLKHTQSCLHCRKQLWALWGQSMRGLEPQCSNFHLRKTGRPLSGEGARGRREGRV